MSCSCRTTSLKVFIQSLTDLRLSEPIVATTGLIQPRYTRAVGLRSQFIFTRTYTATAALGYPRRVLPKKLSVKLPSQHSVTQQPPRATPEKQSNNATVNEPEVEALKASKRDYKKAKKQGAILDFSPEAIDTLVARLEEPPADPIPSNLKFGPAIHDEPKADPKPTKMSSRLKRSKIMKASKGGKRIKGRKGRRGRRLRKEPWRIQKEALREKFPEGWLPRKRLSPDALQGIRALHSQFPDHFTTAVLADKFLISPEAIRRILRSKWDPSLEEAEDRQRRWFDRGKSIWSQMAALGRKPPRRWRREGIVRDPIWNIPRGPRTQPPKQRKPRHFARDADQSLNEISDKAVVEGSGEEVPIRDANEEFHIMMKRNSARRFNQRSNWKSNKGSNRHFNKNSNRHFNRNSNMIFSNEIIKDPHRGSTMGPNNEIVKDPHRGSTMGPNKKPDRIANRKPPKDAFEQAFEGRIDPDSNRGLSRKAHF